MTLEAAGRGRRPLWAPRTLAALCLVGANLFVFALAGLSLDSSRQQFQLRAETSSRNLAALLAQTFSGELARIDLALLDIADLAERQGGAGNRRSEALETIVEREAARVPEVLSFRVAGPDGFVHIGGDVSKDAAPVNYADRDYFITARDHPSAGLIISAPLMGRTSKQWVVILARPLRASDGEFAGVVYALLPVKHFVSLFASLDLRAGDAVALRQGDLAVIARFPDRIGGASAVGNSTVSPEMRQAIERAPDQGTYQALSGIDGVDRVLSYHRIDGHALYVVVGLATRGFLAEWYQELIKIGGAALAFLVVSCASAVALLAAWRSWRAERRVHQTEIGHALTAARRLGETLARKNEEMAQFTEVLAHHLQEPVRQQHVYSQLLLRQLPAPVSPGMSQAAQMVMDGALRLRALLRDVQSYLAADPEFTGGEPSRLDAALDQAMDRLAGPIAETGAIVERGALAGMMVPPERLAELVTILLDNAIRYARRGSPPRIRVASERGDGGTVVSLSDNGIGIPAEFHTRVFRVFERLHPERDRAATGIGLALAKKIVEHYGGRIWIEANAGGGCTVLMAFPNPTVA